MDSDHDDLDFYDDDPSGATDLETALQDLWTIIDAYKPQTIQLESQLKCFIPDYQPAIGDIDPMIKVRRTKCFLYW
jgi:intraflagellar transport protein 46